MVEDETNSFFIFIQMPVVHVTVPVTKSCLLYNFKTIQDILWNFSLWICYEMD